MTRRMLINAQHREELRIAIMDGETLDNFQIEVPEGGLTRGNVYLGIVTNLQTSLNAAFVSYGGGRDGFLPMKEIIPAAYHKQAKNPHRVNEVLERGKSVIVQVTKEPEGQKGGALTTDVSLAGRYLVLTPFEDTRGVSRKVEDDEERAKLKEQASALKVPKGGGFIIRTNALGQSKATLTKDFTSLLRSWKRIQADAEKASQAQLLHRDQDLITRVLRDHLDQSVEEIVIDEEGAFNIASNYVKDFMPRTKLKLVRYTEREPLFARYGVEKQIERIFDRSVQMRSGASIVIDQTEALVAIDVNSGKSTRASSQEELAYNTNLESAQEVARQLRLRDLGGLIVVDFIDMRSPKNRAGVEKALRDAMKSDKARNTIGKISPNGLLEINRQRMQQSLVMRTHRACPTCSGTGRIASPEMVSMGLLRRIEQRAVSGNLRKVRIALHPELADSFQNQRRQQIAELEREFDIQIEVIAASHLHRPQQEVEFVELPAAPKALPVPSPVAAPVAAAQLPVVAENGNGNGKKKRRRRKKKGNGELVALHPDGEPLIDVALPDLEVGEADPKRPSGPAAAGFLDAVLEVEGKKRRRRRRKRGGQSDPTVLPQESVSGDDDDQDEIQPEVAQLAAVVEPAAVEAGTGTPHKRKRRRRKRGGHGEGAAGVPIAPPLESSTAPEGDAGEAIESTPAVHGLAGAEHDGKKRKRRRRRRGGRGGAAGAAGAAEPTDDFAEFEALIDAEHSGGEVQSSWIWSDHETATDPLPAFTPNTREPAGDALLQVEEVPAVESEKQPAKRNRGGRARKPKSATGKVVPPSDSPDTKPPATKTSRKRPAAAVAKKASAARKKAKPAVPKAKVKAKEASPAVAKPARGKKTAKA